MSGATRFAVAFSIISLALLGAAGAAQADISNADSRYVVYARNGLNNLSAQVFLRGTPPKVVTSGLTVEYNILDNKYSSRKRNDGQVLTGVRKLLGEIMPVDKVLNLKDPKSDDRLTGRMVVRNAQFEAHGIPFTRAGDMGIWNPYRVAVVTVKNRKGTVLAQARTAIPTSGEINCGVCHGVDPFKDILQRHDGLHGTSLASEAPVLCSDCHEAPGSA